MTLGQQIKQKREEKGLSQEELAEAVGVSRQAVSKWESGLSAPTGANRRQLCQILGLELDDSGEGEPPRRRRILCAAGWGSAAILLLALICCLLRLRSAAGRSQEQPEPSLHSIHFYDADQKEVLPEALWYNTAAIESILIQWTGETPEAVKLYFTPAGTETIEETELLEVRAPADGENALLLSADPLHRDSLMGHLCFELDFPGDHTITTDSLYNVMFDPELLAS